MSSSIVNTDLTTLDLSNGTGTLVFCDNNGQFLRHYVYGDNGDVDSVINTQMNVKYVLHQMYSV